MIKSLIGTDAETSDEWDEDCLQFCVVLLLVDLMEGAKSACDLCYVLSMEISPCVCTGFPLRQIRGSTELWP